MATTITRTITTGIVYDVMERKGNVLTKIAEVVTPSILRSVKQQNVVLADNAMDVESVLIFNRANEKKYEISEEDFIKYATVVTEIKPSDENSIKERKPEPETETK